MLQSEKRYNSNRRDITRFTLFGEPWTADIPPGYEQIVTGWAQRGDLSYRSDIQGFLPVENLAAFGLGTPADFFYCLVRKLKEAPDG